MKTNHNTISEEEMQVENPIWTICEKTRVCYKLIEYLIRVRTRDIIGDEEKLREAQILLRAIMFDAKRMDAKLRQYKADWDRDMWVKK